MVQQTTLWHKQFTFRGKKLYYNRIPFNNRAERAVEVPVAFNFLARRQEDVPILEIGNVLQHYENGLSDAVGIRNRRIVDKFEVGQGISNIDVMDLDSQEKYPTIISISTMEHVGQNCAPSGQFGEASTLSDLEAPLKAIAKIYDLLAEDGQALITVPFGKLMDGGWYVQFSPAYLDLLVSSYGVPREALTVNCLKSVAYEPRWNNPRQQWIEVDAAELSHVRYHMILGGARSIAVIELTKLARPFTLKTDVPSTPLMYERSRLTRNLSFATGSLLRLFQ